jgi:hypothetical protein
VNQYFVLADDGTKYGPADIANLNQWIADGRLLPTTLLEQEGSGITFRASAVTGLNFPTDSIYSQPPTVPSSSASSPGSPSPGAYGASNAYSSYGSQESSAYAAYPRMGYDGNQVLPKGFNWGAFYFNWIWGLNHRKYLMLISLVIGFIPYVGILGLPLAIWFGFQGNQWAWESGRFTTIEDMMACQRIWAKWALGIFLASLVIGVVAVILIGTLMASQPGL